MSEWVNRPHGVSHTTKREKDSGQQVEYYAVILREKRLQSMERNYREAVCELLSHVHMK